MRFGSSFLLAGTPFAISGLFLCSCIYQPPGTSGSVPPVQEMIRAIPGEWLEEPVVMLSDTVEIRFVYNQSGNTAQRREQTWYYINKARPEVLKNIVVNEFETMEARPDIAISLFYPDGKKIRASAQDMMRFKPVDDDNFSTNRMVNAYTVPRYGQGLIIRLEVAQTNTRPSYLHAEILRDDYPCLEKQVTLAWPSECEIKQCVLNDEAIGIDSVSSSTGPWRSVTVRANRLEKLPVAYSLRYPERWFAGLHFSLPSQGARSMSWRETGDYYLGMIASSFTSSAEIKRLANSITFTNPASIVNEAFRLLQSQVRYIAREQQIYAIVPRPAPEVLAKGYGDCKEMSALLKMMLAEKGVIAHLALVAVTDRFQAIDSIPTLGAFNHMILYLPAFDGKPMFLDPTVRYGHCRNSYYHLMYQKALILEKGHTRFITIEPRPSEGIARVSSSSLIRRSSDNRRWEMRGTIKMYDRAAYLFFPYLKGLKGEESNPGLIAVLKTIFNIEPSSVALDDYNSDSVCVRYAAPLAKQFLNIDRGGFILSSPSLFGGPMTFSTIKQEGPRVFENTEQRDEWLVPDGFTELESTPLDHAIGRGSWSRRGATVSRVFVLHRTVAEPAEEEGSREFMRMQDKFFKATIWHK